MLSEVSTTAKNNIKATDVACLNRVTPLQQQLFDLADPAYRDFHAKLINTVPKESVMGVRLPVIRTFAADFGQTAECIAFLNELPHRFYDENMLHAVLIGRGKDFAQTVAAVERFLPYVDNWAVCDSLRPKVFAKHKTDLLPYIQKWLASSAEFTCRFGMEMLTVHYLDTDFDPVYLEWAAAVTDEQYYVQMMAAWYFATALAKQWDAAVLYLEQKQLHPWVHQKAIRKACESNRIAVEQKRYLRTLK